MTFTNRFISMHKAGSPTPIPQNGQVAVRYDGTTHLYVVFYGENLDFTAWAVETWADLHDNDADSIRDRANLYGRVLSLD